jgi:hypothetical protein
MRIFALMLALLVPVSVWSEPIRVQSGEHDGFSRLVLNGIGAQDWVFGRTEQGYALSLAGDPTGFDVSDVYRLIPRDRVSAIWVDPAGGALNLRIACACHALPYELQAGVLVIDVRDGPAPAGSSFELGLDGKTVPALVAATPNRPKRRPGVATETAPQPALILPSLVDMVTDPPDPNLPALRDLPVEKADMAPLRDSLLRQLSDGSARGVVGLELPLPPTNDAEPAVNQTTLTDHIRLGEDLGVIILPGGKEGIRDKMMADGSACATAEELDLNSWGGDTSVASMIGPATSGLVGEFDDPDPIALERAVKYLLHVGFGAEALGLMTAFRAQTSDEDRLVALAQILEGGPDQKGVFAPMAACDTPAALWAALAAPDLATLADLNRGAVIRSFSALPPALRRYLGPRLADQFLLQNDTETARALTEAVLRGGRVTDAAAQLTEAHVEMALGEGHKAEQSLAEVASGNGEAAVQAMISLVDARIENGQAMTPEQIAALGALTQEFRGSELEPAILRALALAQASRGAFDDAFATTHTFGHDIPEIWTVLAEQGTDDAVLTHAVLGDDAALPAVSGEVREKFARRLLALGLPLPAKQWLANDDSADAQGLERLAQDDASRLLAAEADLMQNDGESAMRQLTGQTGPEADRLRARGYKLMDRPDEAFRQYAALDDTEGMSVAAQTARNWTALMTDADPVWSAAAALVSPKSNEVVEPATGPLARSRALLDESSSTRKTLDQLLSGVPAPEIP